MTIKPVYLLRVGHKFSSNQKGKAGWLKMSQGPQKREEKLFGRSSVLGAETRQASLPSILMKGILQCNRVLRLLTKDPWSDPTEVASCQATIWLGH